MNTSTLIFLLNIVAAVLASWRITELITQDRITAKLRTKIPTYLLQCPRCMSVWAGMWCALLVKLGPVTHNWSNYVNWFCALAWIYVTHLDAKVARRMDTEGRRLIIESRGTNWTMTRNDFNHQESQEILGHVMSAIFQQQQQQGRPAVAMVDDKGRTVPLRPASQEQAAPQTNGKAQS